MATAVVTAVDVSATHCSAEEALLDAYDLQWKAIDIRLEKLRNECERMILEYEVEVKQRMYMRECEDIVRASQAKYDKKEAKLAQELADKDRQLEEAEETVAELKANAKTASAIAAKRKQHVGEVKIPEAEEEGRVEEPPKATLKKTKAATAKRKMQREGEEPVPPPLPQVERKQEQDESKRNAVKKTKKETIAKPASAKKPPLVPRPLSPPVYSPEEEPAMEDESAAEDQPGVDDKQDTSAVDNDLLEMLSQDHGYESEDFGDASSLSLIHPESPAMMSPKRLKAKAALEAKEATKKANPLPTASSPLRGGAASLADRIRNRIQAISAQPLGDASSDASLSPPPLNTPPPKRALKRRKTTAMSPAASPSAATARVMLEKKLEEAAVEKQATAVEVQATAVENQKNTVEEGAKEIEFDKGYKERSAKRKSILKKTPEPAKEAVAEPEPEGETDDVENVVVEKKKAAPKKKLANASQRKKKKQVEAAVPNEIRQETDLPATLVTEPVAETLEPDESLADAKKHEKKLAAISGRSKARKTAKLVALQAAAEEDVSGFSAMHDIKTPKVPRKKMGMDGKKKQISDLAAKRAEFQQILSENARGEDKNEPEDEEAQAVSGTKRRRREEPKARTAPVELEFHTPKPRAKKARTSRNQFANDELNIMKSPVPLLRAKIAEKKKLEEESQAQKKQNKNKRTASQRGGVDEEDPEYGSPAATVSASSVLPSDMLPAPISIKPPTKVPSAPKTSDEIAAAASDYASRWLSSGLVTRARKNAVKAARKPTAITSKPASMWGGGPSFFDAFVNTSAPAIPRLKSTSSVPKE